MDSKYNYCFVSERTDVGCKRQANEDNLVHFECPNGLVATVCDGMGGHVGGAVASQVAVDAIRSFLTENYFENPQEAIGMAIDAANKAILARVRVQPELQGMGSTCVMLIVRDGKVYIGSVGDSRIYLIRSRRIMQLTKDQSFVQLLVDRGEITKEQAEHHPRKNEITNCLGIADMRAATVLPDAIIPEAGDCFLLCSDGLSGMVPDERIEHIVSQQGTYTSQQRVDQLVELARQNGGLDNITVQIVEFAVSPAAVAKRRLPLKWLFGLVALLVVIAACAGLYAWLGGDKPEEKAEVVVVDDTIRVTFLPVPFEAETQLSIIPGAEMDTVVLRAKDKADQSVPIVKSENLFQQLQTQLQGKAAELEYRQDCYIISSFDKLSSDTLALVLQKDSSTYKVQVIKEVQLPASAPEAGTPATPAKPDKKPAPKADKKEDNPSALDHVSKSVTGVTKLEEKDRKDLQKEDDKEDKPAPEQETAPEVKKEQEQPQAAPAETPAEKPADGKATEESQSPEEDPKKQTN